AHKPVQEIYRLERADHHLEMSNQSSVVAEGDDVDAIDPGPLDLLLELQHGTIVAAPFADISEAGAAQDLVRAGQVLERDLATSLWGVHDRTFEHDVGMQQVPQ